jgi:hypothetical protein
MSVPRDHHYLPQWYLARWAVDGELVRYVRPLGADGPVHSARRAPKAVAYERDLYQLPDIADPSESQQLEMLFLQMVDDRAAVSIDKLDRGVRGTAQDRLALSKFVISLLHRSPTRLRAIRNELAKRTDGAPYEGATGEKFDILVKATANRLLAALIESPDSNRRLSEFRAYKIEVGPARRGLLTSDRPVNASAQLIAPDAFLLVPYAPDRLLILTHKQEIARSFASQRPEDLVFGINEAIIDQAEELVVASDRSAEALINDRFLRPPSNLQKDSIGLIRRKAPFIDLMPRRKFPSLRKSDLRYL